MLERSALTVNFFPCEHQGYVYYRTKLCPLWPAVLLQWVREQIDVPLQVGYSALLLTVYHTRTKMPLPFSVFSLHPKENRFCVHHPDIACFIPNDGLGELYLLTGVPNYRSGTRYVPIFFNWTLLQAMKIINIAQVTPIFKLFFACPVSYRRAILNCYSPRRTVLHFLMITICKYKCQYINIRKKNTLNNFYENYH